MSKDLIRLLANEIPDLSTQLDKNVFVYLHINNQNGEVFYVGIGKNYRPYNRTGRNKEWLDYIISINMDYTVKILFEGLDYGEASEKEKELIVKYGRKDKGAGNLLNKTDGGGWTEKYARLNKIYKIKKAKEQLSKIHLIDQLEIQIKNKALECKNIDQFKEKFYDLFLLANTIKIINDITFKECYTKKNFHINTLKKINSFILETQEIYNLNLD